jgi:hypothetical protein
MSGIQDLDRLLKEIKPELVDKEFVFCSVAEDNDLNLDPLLRFKEKEGITIIIEKKIADENSLPYKGVWALITLTVHSDLEAVGFLAKISEKLAEEGISVNVVSAYYHDHLFVPVKLADKAIEVLKNLS